MTSRNITGRALRRMGHARQRLARIKRLRAQRAPGWIIKAEQVAMALNRLGMVAPALGGDCPSRKAGDLYDRYVIPLMVGN